MDHELMTMWLSVDPMADKYPNVSPYAYCAWNPIKLVDPNGEEAVANEDWYQNELTGAIYYNNNVRGAEAAGTGAMKGEGWKHLGENGMFSTDPGWNADFEIVVKNGGSACINNQTGRFDMELLLDGDKAMSVMESVGYKRVPTQIISYNDTYTESFPATPHHNIAITYGEQYDYTEKMAYVPMSYRESGRSIVGRTEYGKINHAKGNVPYANRQTISYSKPNAFVRFFGAVFSGLSTIHGGQHDYVTPHSMGNINNYRGGNALIDRILVR